MIIGAQCQLKLYSCTCGAYVFTLLFSVFICGVLMLMLVFCDPLSKLYTLLLNIPLC